MISSAQSSVDKTGTIRNDILAAHNKYRTDLNIDPLMWSDELASHAQSWADHLASLGGKTLQHSRRDSEGENLWMGTAGSFNYSEMVDYWGNEKQYFIKGIFPNVSSTKNWRDIAHYTQIIWQNSSQVGCAISSAGGNDILVCRYRPAGNWIGQSVYV